MAAKKMNDLVIHMSPTEPRLASPLRAHRQPNTLASLWSRVEHNPMASVLGYCITSISMTLVNKYVVSGRYWNLNFFYLAIQVRWGCDAWWKS